MKLSDNLVVFMQFGYQEERQTTDGHSVGLCPLCGKSGHFFININSTNKTWDCKKCGSSGGFQKFLQSLVAVGNSKENVAKVKELAVNRGLDYKTLKMLQVGYLPVADAWIVPVFSHDGKQILNVKIYDGYSFRNTAGCQAAMYGTWVLPQNYEFVYVAEGEWDAMALIEMLQKVKATRSAVIGVPGAGTFKPATVPYFVGKRVYLLYDNDLSGRNGSKKAQGILSQAAAEIYTINWPEDAPAKLDVRDVYTKKFSRDADQALDWLEESCEMVHIDGAQTVSPGTVEPVCEPVDCQEVYDVYNKWLHLPNTNLIDIIFGTVICNRMPGDPVWLFIVAPPGATKTELLMSLSGGTRIETISTLTPHTLISGANFGGSDPSLIPQLNNKTLIIKDFTAVLGMPSHERDEIFSILRDAYDGECAKPFGNGVTRRYKSRFGILAGTTPAIEQFTDDHAALGERFLRWSNPLSSSFSVRQEYIKRALSNVAKEQEMRADLNGIAKRVLLSTYTNIPTVSQPMQDRIIAQAQWVSTLRATVSRDRYSKDVTHKPFVELSTRISKEIYKLMLGVAMFRGHSSVDSKDMELAAAVSRSSIDQRYLDIVKTMYNDRREYTTNEMKEVSQLPTSTTEMLLGNLAMLGVIKRTVESGKAHWEMYPKFHALTEMSVVF